MQFNPQVNGSNNNKKGNDLNKLASISKLPSPILAKSPKEINEISKYFKKNIGKKETKKLYTQALSFLSSNITMEALNIKENFLNLQNKKLKTSKKSLEVRTSPNLG